MIRQCTYMMKMEESFILFITLLMLTIFHIQCCNVHTSANEVIADYSGLNLQALTGSNQIPNATTKLLLNNNNISGTINTTVFKHLTHLTYLDLSNNFIQKIFAFDGLDFLEYLDLTNNYLCLDRISFPSMLSVLVSLRVFKLMRARGGSCPSPEVKLNGELFSFMKHLEELRINGLQTTFGPGFHTLRKLCILRVTYSNYVFNGSITDDTFKVFKNGAISEISLQNILFKTLSPNAFSYFPYLQTLVITCNHFLGLSPALAAVQNLNTKVLHTLVLDGLGGYYSSSFSKVTYSNFCSQSTLTIKRLTLRGNKMILIDFVILNSTCLPMLEYIALGYNIMMPQNKELRMLNITNLRTIDVSYYGFSSVATYREMYCRHIQETDDYFYKEPNLPKLMSKDIIRPKGKSSIYIPPSVQFVYAQHMSISASCHGNETDYESSINIRFINISHIKARYINDDCGPRVMPKVQYIYAADMELSLIPEIVFKYTPNLIYLNIKNNVLGMFNNSLAFTKYTAKLRTLDISNNGYRSIDDNDVKWFYNLESLILADNKIEYIILNATYMKSLNYLDISGNKLTSLDDNTQDELDKMAKQQNITINLSDNPFICDCDTRSFVKWIQVTPTQLLDKDNYKCKYKHKIVQIISVDSAILETICSPKQFHIYKMALVISIPTLLIVMSITGGVLYYFRWILRWKLYKLQKTVLCKCYGRRLVVDLDLEHRYNALIMSNLEDYHWVNNLLQPKIEDEWEMHLCLEYRDFAGGAPIAECIVDAIERSDKTILILTNNFLHGKCCEFAMQMALTRGKDTLILCVMEELNMGQLSRVLRWLLRNDTTHCVEWTDNENGQQLFWNKLEEALQH